MVNVSTLDLTYLYILKFYKQEPPLDEKKELISDMCTLLQYGYNDKDIMSAIRELNTKAPVTRLCAGKVFSAKNILNPFNFYYHNQLRVTPKECPVIEKDGVITQPDDTPYFLEMRASYTVGELVDYYIKVFGVRPEDVNRGKFSGGFEWLLKKYTIDLVLYMIDSCATSMVLEDLRGPKSPLDVGEYVEIARESLEAKKTEAYTKRCDRIVPRKRTLDFNKQVI